MIYVNLAVILCNVLLLSMLGIKMSSRITELSVLPQEILYNISEYGQITPGLTPEYIEQSVHNIDPNFDWAKEFTLEYLRATDRLYPKIGHIIRSIPQSVIVGVDDDLEDDNTHVIIYVNRFIDPMWSILDREDVSTNEVILGESEAIGILIDTDMVVSGDDSINVFFLAYPRTTVNMPSRGRRGKYSMRKVTNPRDVRSNYPWLLATMNKLGLSRAFPQYFPASSSRSNGYIPSDLEIITAIVKLNPRYDLGDLLSWLSLRSEVCPTLNDSIARRIITGGGMINVEYGEYYDRVYLTIDVTTEGYASQISSYLKNYITGISSMIDVTVPDKPESPGHRDVIASVFNRDRKVLRKILQGLLEYRLCTMNYVPRYYS